MQMSRISNRQQQHRETEKKSQTRTDFQMGTQTHQTHTLYGVDLIN